MIACLVPTVCVASGNSECGRFVGCPFFGRLFLTFTGLRRSPQSVQREEQECPEQRVHRSPDRKVYVQPRLGFPASSNRRISARIACCTTKNPMINANRAAGCSVSSLAPIDEARYPTIVLALP